jgi:hypothetical protein
MMTMNIPNDIQELMADISARAFSARNPRTGKRIVFQIAKGHSYLYFRGDDGNDYCYTPHPDTDGWFYSFAYIGVGPGSRTGKAKSWKLKYLKCHRKRKAAKVRALTLYHTAQLVNALEAE